MTTISLHGIPYRFSCNFAHHGREQAVTRRPSWNCLWWEIFDRRLWMVLTFVPRREGGREFNEGDLLALKPERCNSRRLCLLSLLQRSLLILPIQKLSPLYDIKSTQKASDSLCTRYVEVLTISTLSPFSRVRHGLEEVRQE